MPAKKLFLMISFALLTALATSALAADVQWNNAGGDRLWRNSANWDLGYVPTLSDKAAIRDAFVSGPIIDSSTSGDVLQVVLSDWSSSGDTLDMTGGTLTTGDWFVVGYQPVNNGTFNMSAGTVSVGGNLIVGNMGAGTMNMTGGSITVTGTFGIAQSGGAGDVFLDGGTISCGSFSMASGAAMDITEGTLIVNGDVTSTINQYISNGWLTAYEGSGTLNVDYNVTNPGKTTVTADTPEKASYPSPINGGTGVSINADLSWSAGIYAVSHDVYFGTDFSDVNSAARLPGDLDGSGTVDYNDLFILTDYWLADPFGSEPYAGINDDNIVDFFDYALLAQDFSDSASAAFKGNQTADSYNPDTLALSTTYYWRIDEVNASGTTTGTVWSFTTAAAPPPLPGQATNPSPADGATGVSTIADLTWTGGSDATSHDVYFGTTSPGTFQGNQMTTTFNAGTMATNTTYYWRINEKNTTGTTTGVVWSFSTGTPAEFHPYLSWKSDPTNSIVVNWWNPNATGDSTVDYGLTSSYGSTAYNSTVSNFHHVELTGLTSGTTYHYRISSSDGTVGNDETFTTSTVSPTSFKFAVFGDTQINYNEHRAQCDHMVQKNPDFVLHTGDLVQYGDSETDWKDFFKAEQNLSKSRVFMPTMGNHEVQPGGQPYYYFFDLYADGLAVPANGMAGYGPRTYSFDYGNTHHIIISSYQINVALEKDWIAADLAAAAANPDIEWIFAYMHKPLYTAGQWPADKTVLALWGPEFDQYGVDIVFAGHNHIYERSYPINNDQIVSPGEGTIYMTCGLGANPGGSWDPGSPDAPFFETWYTPNKTGATYITINGSSLSAELIMVDNAVLDTFTITK